MSISHHSNRGILDFGIGLNLVPANQHSYVYVKPSADNLDGMAIDDDELFRKPYTATLNY